MQWYDILAIILLSLTFLFFFATFACYFVAFYIGKKKIYKDDEYDIPPGKAYEPYRDILTEWMKEMRKLPHQDIEITSFDNLKLHGKYFECGKGNTLEIMFHGYRGSAERDLCGGVKRAFALNHNVLIVDQRAACRSDGHTITFGINERRDCMSWLNYVLENFDEDTKIILTGVSMGAATVIMASEMELPPNVIGVLADCSYSTQEGAIKKFIKEIHLPPNLAYPFVKLGARIYGRFNLEETTPLKSIKNAKVPIILFHGEDDQMVPCYMSHELHEANKKMTHLVTIPKAGHCLCYLVEPELYLNEMRKFFNE